MCTALIWYVRLLCAQLHFQRLQRGSWNDAQFANGAEAMSAVLELVRRHQARQLVFTTLPYPTLLSCACACCRA